MKKIIGMTFAGALSISLLAGGVASAEFNVPNSRNLQSYHVAEVQYQGTLLQDIVQSSGMTLEQVIYSIWELRNVEGLTLYHALDVANARANWDTHGVVSTNVVAQASFNLVMDNMLGRNTFTDIEFNPGYHLERAESRIKELKALENDGSENGGGENGGGAYDDRDSGENDYKRDLEIFKTDVGNLYDIVIRQMLGSGILAEANIDLWANVISARHGLCVDEKSAVDVYLYDEFGYDFDGLMSKINGEFVARLNSAQLSLITWAVSELYSNQERISWGHHIFIGTVKRVLESGSHSPHPEFVSIVESIADMVAELAYQAGVDIESDAGDDSVADSDNGDETYKGGETDENEESPTGISPEESPEEDTSENSTETSREESPCDSDESDSESTLAESENGGSENGNDGLTDTDGPRISVLGWVMIGVSSVLMVATGILFLIGRKVKRG